MAEHIDPEELSLYVDQQGTAEERERISLHIGHCPGCAQDVENFERLKLRLSSLPKHYAPPSLVAALRQTHLRKAPSLLHRLQFFWKPLSALAVGLLISSFWIFRQSDTSQDHVDMDALLEAHSKYQMESLVPQPDLARSDYSARLASFYRDEE
jgi:anti-sigma factor RsiW